MQFTLQFLPKLANFAEPSGRDGEYRPAAGIRRAGGVKQPLPQQQTISKEEQQEPTPEISKASCEIEQIGDTIVIIDFIEYTGKRKKKVTHIKVKHSEIDQMINQAGSQVGVQFALF